ncbi:MAG: hypothetical protein JNL84_07590 [Candidatus Accumulibacter sp.]|nr:hypothetical protein [Accumulibacter sp.]
MRRHGLADGADNGVPAPSASSGASLWFTLRSAPTQSRRWLELAGEYRCHDLPWQAGYAARQALRLNPGLRTPKSTP